MGDLKRVGVVFTADGVQDFVSSLSLVNSSIQENISAYKLAQSEWKGSTTVTQKLGDKQKFLAAQCGDYAQKVELLSRELSQMENAENRDEAAINRKRAQLENAQKQLNTYKKRLEDVNKQLSSGAAALDDYGKRVESAGQAMEKTGKTLSATVTAPIVALGTAAVKTTADFEEQMDKVSAVSMASAEDIGRLAEKARELGADPRTRQNAGEIAAGYEYMAMAGWKAEDMLEGIEGIMNLAAASGEDLATTSDIVTDALTAFGLSAKDSGHFADVLAAASSNANTNVSLMGETFKYAAPIAGALGFSAEDTAEAIGLMANAGIKGSQAGTALRTIMNNLTEDVTLSGEALGDVTIATTNADGSMRELSGILADCRKAFALLSESEKATTAEALVGKNAMSGFLALMNAAPEDIEKLSGALGACSETYAKTADGVMTLSQAQSRGLEVIEEYSGASEAMAAMMGDNLNGQVEALKGQLSELAIQVGEIILPYVSQLVDWLSRLAEGFSNLDPKTKETIVKVAALAAAIGPLLIVGGKVATGIGTLMQLGSKIMLHMDAINAAVGAFTGAVGGLLKGLFALIQAHPVIAVGTAIIAALVLLYNKCEWFRDGVNAVIGHVRDFVVGAGEAIKEKFPHSWEEARQMVADKVQAIKENVTEKFEAAKGIALEKIDALKNGVSERFEAVKSKIHDALETAKGYFNFSWELPKLKLPHFSINGSFSLNPPSVPSLGVEWYAKGGIMKRPTVFGVNGDMLMAGGENGAEAIAPVELLKGYIRDAMQDGGGLDASALRQVIKEAVRDGFRAAGVTVDLDGDAVGKFVSRKIKEELFA